MKGIINYLFFILLGGFCGWSCNDEGLSVPDDTQDLRVIISLLQPARIDNDLTRSTMDYFNYNRIDDLNVAIYLTDGTALVRYFDASSSENGNPGFPIESGEATLELGRIAEFDRILLVSNLGRKLLQAEVGNHPDMLKSLKIRLPQGNIPETCVMFAESEVRNYRDGVLFLRAELMRTLSMVTVSVEMGGSLMEGIEITPSRVNICNVPISCLLGYPNATTSDTDKPAKEGYGIVFENRLVLNKSGDRFGVENHQSGTQALFLFEKCAGSNG